MVGGGIVAEDGVGVGTGESTREEVEQMTDASS